MELKPVVQTCSLCQAWIAKQWDGVSFTDEQAPCSIEQYGIRQRNDVCQYWIPRTYNHFQTTIQIISKNEESDKEKFERLRTEAIKATLAGQNNAIVKKKAQPKETNVDSLDQQMLDWYEKNKVKFGVQVEKSESIVYDKQEGDVSYDETNENLRIVLQPSAKGNKLFKHQQEDILRYIDKKEDALFLEMGCGKSATSLRIASYLFLTQQIGQLLIIAPNGVHRQWAVEQIPLWVPPEVPYELQCFGGRGGADDTYPFYDDNAMHIVCNNIDTFSQPTKWKDIADWVKATRCMIILDEATCIKSIKATRTERLLYEFNDVTKHGRVITASIPRTVARAVLTGTPVTNSVTDLWSIMEFLRPYYFRRNWYSFRAYFCMLATIPTAYGSTQIQITKDIWKGVKACKDYESAYATFGVSQDTYYTIQSQMEWAGCYKHEQELRDLLAPVATFRLLKDCVSIKEPIYNRKIVQLSPEQTKAYSMMETQLLAKYGGAITTAVNKLSALIRLAQISSGFIVQGMFQYNPEQFELESVEDINEHDLEPGQVQWLGNKVPKLEALYRDIEECSKPCIIITRFSAEAARIFDDLSKEHSTLLWTGWKKTGDLEDFKVGKYEVLVANIRAVSRGFNLQNSCQMFFYSNTFSLEDRLQTEGRILRPGQRNICVYTDYVNENTIDIKTVGALRQKRQLLDYVRGQSLTAFITEEDEVTMMEGVA